MTYAVNQTNRIAPCQTTSARVLQGCVFTATGRFSGGSLDINPQSLPSPEAYTDEVMIRFKTLWPVQYPASDRMPCHFDDPEGEVTYVGAKSRAPDALTGDFDFDLLLPNPASPAGQITPPRPVTVLFCAYKAGDPQGSYTSEPVVLIY